MPGLDELLSNSSPSICSSEPELTEEVVALAGPFENDLLRILRKRNGFYAFESALHFFPARSTHAELGLDDWNRETLWRNAYEGLADGCLFFAEDVFGGQFCISDSRVFSFDPETGELDYLADDIDGWVKEIIGDFEVLTGYPLAHRWQVEYGKIPANKRLLPKIPFVTGGEFAVDNLYLGDAVEGMKFRASLASQIKDLPDGAEIEFKLRS